MSQVLQSDMDALAQAANDVLLPVINSQIDGLGCIDSNIYDVSAGDYIYYDVTVVPQPPYSFPQNTFTNLISSSAVFDGSGKYVYTISTTGYYQVLIGSGEYFETTDQSSYINFYDLMTPRSNRLYLTSGKTITISGTIGASVKSKISVYNSWLFELNRIRGDLMAVLAGGSHGAYTVPSSGLLGVPLYSFGTPLFMAPQAVCSGPWLVYVNDPSQYDMGKYNGILYGTFNGTNWRSDANWYQCFCSVAFYTTDNTVQIQTSLGDGLTSGSIAWDTTNSGYNYTSTIGMSATGATGNLQTSVTFSVTISAAYSGALYDHAPASAPSFGIAASIGSVSSVILTNYSHSFDPHNNTGSFSAAYAVTVNINQAFSSGSLVATYNSSSFFPSLSGDPDASYTSQTTSITSATFNALKFIIGTSAAGTPYSNVIHPTNPGYRVVAGTGQSVLRIYNSTASLYPTPCWTLTNPNSSGVWEAMTLPVPAQNVFLDQDFYNYTIKYAHIGVLPSGMGTTTGESYENTSTGGLINSVQPITTPKPTKWPVIRSTEFLPYVCQNYESCVLGYLGNDPVMVNIGGIWQTLPLSIRVFYNNDIVIAARAPGMNLNMVGWLNGVNQIGYPHPTKTFTIFVSKNGGVGINPANPATYDFSITGDDVRIPGNAPAGYWESILSGTGQVHYCVTTTDNTFTTLSTYIGNSPKSSDKMFFVGYSTGKENQETYSYSLYGDPVMLLQEDIRLNYGDVFQKLTPRSGYCIFKVKASRLPQDVGRGIQLTPASGADLTITLGQYVTDNSNPANVYFEPFMADNGLDKLTIEIPDTASDSGEVAVYLPVLGGNELVYQCSQQVILEAWVNWQPIWFSNVFANFDYRAFDHGAFESYGLVPQPLQFQHCLAFVNYAWNQTGNAQATYVQYPLAKCIFDDIISLMRIINPNYNYPQIGVGNDSWNTNQL